MADDERFLKRSLELARMPAEPTFPNPLVGAVLVSGGEIVGEGYHRAAGKPHAEVEAITQAGESARGGTLYLNLEPCCHYGKTPPCTDAIIGAGIARVVFGILDPDERVRGRGAGILRNNGVSVEWGFCAGESLEINLPYVHRQIAGKTFVVLKLASTLDGRLTAAGRTWLTGDQARVYAHSLRAGVEAVVVGIGTLIEDRPLLDRRFAGGNLAPPVRMVFDPDLLIPVDYPWLANGETVIVYCLETADTDRRRALEDAGAEIVDLTGGDGLIDMRAWVGDISSRGFTAVMIEGGGKVATSVLESGCVDRLVLFYAPIIAGPGGVSWFQKSGEPAWLGDEQLVPCRQEFMGRDLLAIYDRSHVGGYMELVTKEHALVHRIDR